MAKVDNTLRDLQNSSYLTKAEFKVLLFVQNNSNKNKLKHGYLGRCLSPYRWCIFIGSFKGDRGLFRSANILQTADVVRRVVVWLFLPCF